MLTRKELKKIFEKNYGYKKTSIWNINGLTVDANNIDEEVTKKLDRELRGYRECKPQFLSPVIITKRCENYFVKVELESEEIRWLDKNEKEIHVEDEEKLYFLKFHIEGYWITEYDYSTITFKNYFPCSPDISENSWENYNFKNIINMVNETIDNYFLEEVLIKLIQRDLI